MNQPKLILCRIIARKLGAIVLLLVTAAGAFATIGERYNAEGPKKKSLLTTTPVTKPGTFTLRSGYSYRGSQILATEEKKQVRLNTVVTVQRGNTTYIVPLKKKLVLDKVKIQFGNQQLRRN
jgi:hypothetical protein